MKTIKLIIVAVLIGLTLEFLRILAGFDIAVFTGISFIFAWLYVDRGSNGKA